MRNILTLILFTSFTTINIYSQKLNNTPVFPDYPQMKFIVFSDPHYFDSSLGTQGQAFQDYLDKDRKLLRESSELLEEVIDFIQKSDADFVLIPGDLTKDGEHINHVKMMEYLDQIRKTGKNVFVVPGNHDVNVPAAFKFNGDKKERVPTVSKEEFADMYSAFGYGEAVFRDENSLSYVAQPTEGFWLLALDACRYKENPDKGRPITSGRFSKETDAS